MELNQWMKQKTLSENRNPVKYLSRMKSIAVSHSDNRLVVRLGFVRAEHKSRSIRKITSEGFLAHAPVKLRNLGDEICFLCTQATAMR